MANVQTAEKQNIVNGIDVDFLNEVLRTVKRNPDAGATYWHVRNTWQGQTQNRAEGTTIRIGNETEKRTWTLDFDEPFQLGGSNKHPNPQEYLLAAVSSCMMVGYAALCALYGITLEKLVVEIEGEIDLRGFLGVDKTVNPGYDNLDYTVHIKGDGTKEQFEEIHEMVMATSPNFANMARAVTMNPTLNVE